MLLYLFFYTNSHYGTQIGSYLYYNYVDRSETLYKKTGSTPLSIKMSMIIIHKIIYEVLLKEILIRWLNFKIAETGGRIQGRKSSAAAILKDLHL